MTQRKPAPRRLLVVALVMTALALAAADDFSFSADSMNGSMARGRERVVLQGNALVVSDGMRITADKIELHGDDFRFAECSGHVRVDDEDRGLKLSTETLFYDRRDKLSRLTGPSVMEDRTNKVVIKGDYIENDDKRKVALVQINVRILKDKLSCRAQFARYDREAKTLELSGSPTVRRDGDDYSASTILVNLDTEDIVLLGSVSGTVVSGDKKTDAEEQPAEPSSEPSTEPVAEPAAEPSVAPGASDAAPAAASPQDEAAPEQQPSEAAP